MLQKLSLLPCHKWKYNTIILCVIENNLQILILWYNQSNVIKLTNMKRIYVQLEQNIPIK